MGSKNRLQTVSDNTTFTVFREMPYLHSESGKGIFGKPKESPHEQSILNSPDKNVGLGMDVIRKIEETLSLTYVAERRGEGNVCMANSPEIRDDYRDVFVIKNLQDYICAVVHSSGYNSKYSASSKTDLLQIPYPDNHERFWKLVGHGAKLQQILMFEPRSAEKYSDETNNIIKNIDDEIYKVYK